MEYLIGLLGVIAGSFVTYSFLVTNGGGRDKRARQAVEELARKIGMDIKIYDFVSPYVYEESAFVLGAKRKLLNGIDFENSKKIDAKFAEHAKWFKGISDYFGIVYQEEQNRTLPGQLVLKNPKAPAYTTPVAPRKRNR